jgi:hypothetical protein
VSAVTGPPTAMAWQVVRFRGVLARGPPAAIASETRKTGS